MAKTTRERVCKVIQGILATHPQDIKDEHHLVEDYGADSLDCCELLIDLEDEFGVSIEDDDFKKNQKVGQLVTLIERLT